MEPLFKSSVPRVDVILMSIKERLMLNDECAQLSSVERISNLFKCGGAADANAVLSQLIKFDVLSAMFEILQSPTDRLLSCILDVLNLISVYRNFYEYHVVMDALDSLLKVTICVLKSRCKETNTLWKLVCIIHNILQRGIEFHRDLYSICVPNRIIVLLESLILEAPMDQNLKFCSISLLTIVLENINTETKLENILFEMTHKALTLTKEIVEYSDDSSSIPLAAAALCAVCASGTRLCVSGSDSRGIFDNVAQRGGTLAKAVYSATMNTLIPYFKSAELNGTDSDKFHGNLVTCLNSLYKLSECSRDNLSNHLTANGYLKRFLLLTASFPENLRRSTCMLLSRIISTLADKSLPIGQWPDSAISFENSMHRGLFDLPKDIQQWNNVMACGSNSSIALITSIYYHYHGTRENDMIPLKPLIIRIINLPKSQASPQTLKILWFLFAIASMSHPSPNLEQNYSKAAQTLAKLLQYSRLNECYTHHIDLLRYCLTFNDVPRDLRKKVLDLWLIESQGDIKPLLTLDCDKVVRHYLLLVIQTGYSENVINLAMKGIRDMIRVDNAREIAEIAWHMLPNLLSSYHPDKDEQVKAVLELTNIFIPDSLSLSAKYRCAASLQTIILRRDANLKLRTLAVMQSYVLLVTSATAKPFAIFDKYVKTSNFLEELLLQGFSGETPELAAVCLKLLAFIVHCQQKLSVERDEPLIIDAQSLADLLVKACDYAHFVTNAMQLVLEIFNQNPDRLIIKLIAKEKVSEVVNLYEVLYVIYGKCDPTQRDIVCQCRESILRFCHTQAKPLMYHLCTLLSNNDLASWICTAGYVSCHLLEFLSTWLRYRRRYCNDEGLWNARSICRTPFEETLDLISRYVDMVKDTRVDRAFYNLRYANRFNPWSHDTSSSEDELQIDVYTDTLERLNVEENDSSDSDIVQPTRHRRNRIDSDSDESDTEEDTKL